MHSVILGVFIHRPIQRITLQACSETSIAVIPTEFRGRKRLIRDVLLTEAGEPARETTEESHGLASETFEECLFGEHGGKGFESPLGNTPHRSVHAVRRLLPRDPSTHLLFELTQIHAL